ncbi:hypothetical protein CMT31_05525 [Elizabethkingia anophelis]|nr:hypothetical protein [Elizabethkingia anophelis]
MKSIYISLSEGLKELDQRWLNLSVQKQRKYLICFFFAYLLLTFMVIIHVCKDLRMQKNKISIEHIKRKDTLRIRPSNLSEDNISLIFKNNNDGKK